MQSYLSKGDKKFTSILKKYLFFSGRQAIIAFTIGHITERKTTDTWQQFWCPDCKEWHWTTVLGGKIEISKSTALVKQKLCIGCRKPTTGSIGQAGYYWPYLCQWCKDEADGVYNHTVRNVRYLLDKVFA